MQCPQCNGSGEMHHVEDGVTVAQQCSLCAGFGTFTPTLEDEDEDDHTCSICSHSFDDCTCLKDRRR